MIVFQVELLELLSEMDFKVIQFLENGGKCQTVTDNKHFLGVSSIVYLLSLMYFYFFYLFISIDEKIV